jgi:hypothetical protein
MQASPPTRCSQNPGFLSHSSSFRGFKLQTVSKVGFWSRYQPPFPRHGCATEPLPNAIETTVLRLAPRLIRAVGSDW